MLITRCAWHRGYHGHPALIGVTDWRGLRLGFSDGICSQCAAQLRADVPGSPPTEPRGRADVVGWMPGVGLVSVGVMAIVLLAAKPVHEPDGHAITAAALPGEGGGVADQPHEGGVAAPSRSQTRIGSPVTRQAQQRVAGASRARASAHPASTPRVPSPQAP